MEDRKMKFSYLISEEKVTVFDPSEGKQLFLYKESHPRTFGEVVRMLMEEEICEIDVILDLCRTTPFDDLFEENDNFSITDDKVLWKGIEVNNSLVRRIRDYKKSSGVNMLEKFLENLLMNPKKEIVDELYDFLDSNSLPITSDGNFLAYKAVSNQYLDIYSNTMDNSIGAVVSEDREECDPDRNRTCSRGLHFATYDYVRSSYTFEDYEGPRMVVVEINPKDVVAIPTDYNNQKGRACEYKVISEVKEVEAFRIRDNFIEESDDVLEEYDDYDDDDDYDDLAFDNAMDTYIGIESYVDGMTSFVKDSENIYILANLPAGKSLYSFFHTVVERNPEYVRVAERYSIKVKLSNRADITSKDRVILLKIDPMDNTAKIATEVI
jgi:hypothetical protein